MTTNSAIQPTAINADRDAGLVTIDWADGHRSQYTAVALRWLCPCAFCRGEAGARGGDAGVAGLNAKLDARTDTTRGNAPRRPVCPGAHVGRRARHGLLHL